MQTLCEITDWTTSTVERGRGTGNEITTRSVIAADNWNWIVGIEKKSTDPKKPNTVVGQTFHGSIRLLAAHFAKEQPGSLTSLLPNIARALTNQTGTAINVPICCTDGEWINFAKMIDRTFDCSYAQMDREYPPTIYKRIFKVEDEE